MSIYIGLDLGGTKFMVAAADQVGSMTHRVRAVTPYDLEAGLALIDQMIEEVAAGQSISAIGAAIGGPLDWERGIVSPLHQPTWRDVPLKDLIEQRWQCPFLVDVDTNVAALGEYALGQHAARLLYITVSTGMGGGFLVDGEVYRGSSGAHPEVAHQSINMRCRFPERVMCECGAPDCLEALISGNGIQRMYHKPAETLDPQEWDEVAYNLGQGLRNLATIYAPDLIVLGGGVAVGGGTHLIDQASAVMREHLRLVPAPVVQLSKLGYDTALHGAIVLASRAV